MGGLEKKMSQVNNVLLYSIILSDEIKHIALQIKKNSKGESS